MSPYVRFNMDDLAYQRMLEKKKDDGFQNKGLKYYFEWLFKPVVIHPTITQAIQKATKSHLAPMWMRNLGDNLPRIRNSELSLRDLLPKDPDDPKTWPKKKCVVLGRGPSMFNKGHLEMIYESDLYQNDELVVVSCDGALKDALKAGIVPDYVTGVDGSDVCTKWYDGVLSEQLEVRDQSQAKEWRGWSSDHGEEQGVVPVKTKAVIGTQVSKKVVDQLYNLVGRDHVYWYMPSADDINRDQSITRRMALLTVGRMENGVSCLDSGGNVGTLSYIFAFNILFHSNICLVGMDCGYPEDMPLDETYYWENTYSTLDAFKQLQYTYKFHNPYFDEKYWYDPVFRSYRESFYEFVIRKPDWLKLFNASSGTLYYPPWIQAIHLNKWLGGEE